ncbi:hypothetical protein TIFTF001_046518 [Ficus carica]|uniref:Uncharacterized protein n=1 Tax=Ficus carica TaxID=3494 RepID=A0AA88DA00_FICCA|nr:hypothetical protein TIFTF001_046518 [Ficus carica]
MKLLGWQDCNPMTDYQNSAQILLMSKKPPAATPNVIGWSDQASLAVRGTRVIQPGQLSRAPGGRIGLRLVGAIGPMD